MIWQRQMPAKPTMGLTHASTIKTATIDLLKSVAAAGGPRLVLMQEPYIGTIGGTSVLALPYTRSSLNDSAVWAVT